ncbi:MAG: SDR family NAD(P)-dependent oxidoreductase [Halieaceae bacterium]|jgi:NAD(P)-dependent dehydrogenase (short-subunit alcohol dehydrogenase family)|nr:SDR family NAD(P)-dependent oxidoreductase [Halieaceae bacterium]
MLDLQGKTAVISGGADGIGLALARAFGARGMNIVLADIEAPQLSKAAAELEKEGLSVLAVEMDVALREDWERTARQAGERFGDVHMLVNNAGVSGGIGSFGAMDESGWRWTIDVNLMGVVYGAETFVPLMRAHGDDAWVINVASMAGMGGVPMAGAYTATKAAVVALAEAWALELAQSNIQVSVLCPAFVRTRIHQSYRNRQPRYAMTTPPTPEMIEVGKGTAKAVENGIDAALLAARVIEAMEAGELYIFTHPNYQAVTDHRSAAIADAFARAAGSEMLQEVREQPMTFGFSGD